MTAPGNARNLAAFLRCFHPVGQIMFSADFRLNQINGNPRARSAASSLDRFALR